MVNRPLLNPVQSKREYFWLFLIVVLENIIALCIELYNGGVWTSQVGDDGIINKLVELKFFEDECDSKDVLYSNNFV